MVLVGRQWRDRETIQLAHRAETGCPFSEPAHGTNARTRPSNSHIDVFPTNSRPTCPHHAGQTLRLC